MCNVASGEIIIMSAIEGIPAELGVLANGTTILEHAGTLSKEDGFFVLRNISVGTGAALVASGPAGSVKFVVLPADQIDNVWKGTLSGQETVFLSNSSYILTNENSLDVRSVSDMAVVSVLPAPAVFNGPHGPLVPSPDGLFSLYTIRTPPPPTIYATLTRKSPGGPPREVPKSPAGKAQVCLQPTDLFE